MYKIFIILILLLLLPTISLSNMVYGYGQSDIDTQCYSAHYDFSNEGYFPSLGFDYFSDNSYYASIGINYCNCIRLGFNAGYYKGSYLGYEIEFKSLIGVSFDRFEVNIFHISNAHLSKRNPGLNVIQFGFKF